MPATMPTEEQFNIRETLTGVVDDQVIKLVVETDDARLIGLNLNALTALNLARFLNDLLSR